jgi:lipopolysaccharide transport system permease protein
MWLFATPVVYPSSLVAEPWRTLTAINPMVGVVEGFRWAVLGSEIQLSLIGISAVSAAIIFLAGLAYFDRVERGFADFV